MPDPTDKGPEVWINLEMGRYVEKASRDRYVYDACDWERRNHVRYVPAAAAERRIAELEAERDTLAEQMRDATEHIIGLDDALATADRERAAAVKRAQEAEAKLSDATAALKKAGEAIDILRKGPLVLR